MLTVPFEYGPRRSRVRARWAHFRAWVVRSGAVVPVLMSHVFSGAAFLAAAVAYEARDGLRVGAMGVAGLCTALAWYFVITRHDERTAERRHLLRRLHEAETRVRGLEGRWVRGLED